MKKAEVPQDNGMNRGVREITYAVDENGKYVLASSAGWEPKTIVNEQAWEEITQEIADVLKAIRTGKKSPIAYHMTRNLMTPGLLASYAGLSQRRVRRHLKAKTYRKLDPEILQRYADVFGISVEALNRLPENMEDIYED